MHNLVENLSWYDKEGKNYKNIICIKILNILLKRLWSSFLIFDHFCDIMQTTYRKKKTRNYIIVKTANELCNK